MAELDPKIDIFDKNSCGPIVTKVALGVAVLLFALTIALTIGAFRCGGPRWGSVVAALALAWAVGAPAWFWFEYFFLYRIYGTPGSFELYKHGQQLSVAVWAGLALSLGAFASSDRFKQPETNAAATGAAALRAASGVANAKPQASK
ncbi:hypothetical protein [Piscinibacter sp. HJYY11]|uniref:hypothetical protein n=1 Tax=Piscinibacter sp. HJYY11 TaxID=2801333 RepID=UPI00191EC4B2|nr:hypothetical protein [Piscinibacter sp. HJYY11]MBL0729447.1 hypothetical protein [Piscinibacter sp. HJYY11]